MLNAEWRIFKKEFRKDIIMAKRNAFTLAEVLITLGIIGVVAAMTLPTLLNSTQAAQFRSQFKKTLSVASQAMVVTVALDDYDAAQANSTASGQDATTHEFHASLYNMFDRRLNVVGHGGDTGRANAWTVTTPTGGSNNASIVATNYTFYLNDGSTLSIPSSASQCTAGRPCKGVIDVNGPKMPNKTIACDTGTTDADCRSTAAGDVFPVIIHDQLIEPGSPAARYVLYKGGK